MIKYIWCKICHFNHLQCTIQCVNHIHTVVQPSLFCVSKSFLSPQTETINTRAISPISLTSQPLVTSPLLSVSTNLLCFPHGSLVKNLPANVRNAGLIPCLRKTPGEGNGTPHHCSCLGNPVDRGAWWATGHGAGGSQNSQIQLSVNWTMTFPISRITPSFCNWLLHLVFYQGSSRLQHASQMYSFL